MVMNTYEKVKGYLELHKSLSYNIEYYRNKMGGLKAISYSNEDKGTQMTNDMMTVYAHKIDEAEKKQRDIEHFIDKNFIGKDRLILFYRYVNYMTLKEVGEKLGYSISNVDKKIRKIIYGYLARH